MTENKNAKAYVDGSFNPEKQKYAYGCVLFHPDGESERLCGSGNSPDALKQRNVAGEMIAAMLAVRWALVNKYSSIEIYHDYEGIRCWVTGEWKAKNELTGKYRDAMRRWQANIDISFCKVTAHSNDTYNELADKLAKEGLEREVGLPDIVPRQS